LVILALPIGAVESTTLDDLISRARARKDKRLVLVNPKLPVLSAIYTHTHQLVLGKPARGDQINRTVQLGAELAGITEHVIAHDLRRGAVRDVVNLSKSTVKGQVGRLVAKAVGHSEGTLVKGVTDAYSGHLKDNIWKARLDEAQSEEFGLTTTSRPFKRQRCTKDKIDIYCKENSLDSANANDRVKASHGVKRQEKEIWADQERNGTVNDIDGADLISGKQKNIGIREVIEY
jgi:hypothetical protein